MVIAILDANLVMLAPHRADLVQTGAAQNVNLLVQEDVLVHVLENVKVIAKDTATQSVMVDAQMLVVDVQILVAVVQRIAEVDAGMGVTENVKVHVLENVQEHVPLPVVQGAKIT